MDLRLAVSTRIARAVGTLARRSGRGAGTSLPGKVLIRLDPDAVTRLSGSFPAGIGLISATNGKTTTAAMVGAILAPESPVRRNTAGANLIGGLAAALVARQADERAAVFEVDEAALPQAVRATQPRLLALGNLFRDQLDRHGEMEHLAERWRSMVAVLPERTGLIVNADDPVLDDLAAIVDGATRYGIDDPGVGRERLEESADSTFCVRCGAAYQYRTVYYGHLGDFACPQCGHARGSLDLAAREVRLEGVRGTRFTLVAQDDEIPISLPLPGLYNVHNALAAIAVASGFGVTPRVAAERLAAMEAAFGRFERMTVDERDVAVVLIKNPAGANEALRAIAGDLDGAPLVLALNDRIADGRDVSWIWDVDFEGIVDRAGRILCAGERAADLAVRMRYADVHASRIEIVEDPLAAFDRAVAGAEAGAPVYVLPTYTAMLALRRALATRGVGRAFWEEGS